MTRIFGVGLNKTGTTSLSVALRILGYRAVHHGRRTDSNIERAIATGRPMLRYSGLRVRMAHAFLDLRSIERHFEIVHREFPDARFILTTRDRDGWLDSREKHVIRNRERAERGVYKGTWFTIDRPEWEREWDEHHARVANFFGTDAPNLLVMDVIAGDGWEKLAPFLGHPEPDVPFPHRNTRHET